MVRYSEAIHSDVKSTTQKLRMGRSGAMVLLGANLFYQGFF